MASVKAPTASKDLPTQSLLDSALELVLPAVVLVHLVVAPYTKVEESFNLQAVHDVIAWGFPLGNSTKLTASYDHFMFPGVVPRTFLGAASLGGVAAPFVDALGQGVYRQIFVRAILGVYNAYAMIILSRQAAVSFGKNAARWYILLQASQFHIIYYASRTLPNMFAYGLTVHAIVNLLPAPRGKRQATFHDTTNIGIALLVFCGIVFRSELAVLLATHSLPLLLTRQITVLHLISLGVVSALISLAIAVPVDTFFWQTWPKPMWAELEGFWFNTVAGKSSEWGTSPIWYYFGNSLPKMLLNPMTMLLLPLGVYTGGPQRMMERLVGPALVYVAIYSFLPHKEWRFVAYVVPSLTLTAAVGADWIFSRRLKSVLYALGSVAIVASIIGSLAISSGMLWVSSLNYPGGFALSLLDKIATNETDITIHLDVFTCMTGASRFTQNDILHPTWQYLKTEESDILSTKEFWDKIDYVVTANYSQLLGEFHEVGFVDGYAGVGFVNLGKGELSDVQGFVVGGRDLALTFRGVAPKGMWPLVKMETMIRIFKKGPPPDMEEDLSEQTSGRAPAKDEL